MTAPAFVQNLWNYCNILLDKGLPHSDYVEVRAARAFAFLAILKITEEQSRAPRNQPSPVGKGFDWPALVKIEGDDLETLDRNILGEPRQFQPKGRRARKQRQASDQRGSLPPTSNSSPPPQKNSWNEHRMSAERHVGRVAQMIGHA